MTRNFDNKKTRLDVLFVFALNKFQYNNLHLKLFNEAMNAVESNNSSESNGKPTLNEVHWMFATREQINLLKRQILDKVWLNGMLLKSHSLLHLVH